MAQLQAIAAAALVLVSALYAGWRLAPARVRARLLGGIANAPGVAGRWRWLAKLHASSLQQTGGCGGCGAGAVRPRSAARSRTPAVPRR